MPKARKKPTRHAANPWLRQRSRCPPDPQPGEPHLADFFRHEVPPPLALLDIAKSGVVPLLKTLYPEIAERFTPELVASLLHNIALHYRQGFGIEDKLASYREAAAADKLSDLEHKTLKLHKQQDGQPKQFADSTLIQLVYQFLRQVKGDNTPIQWEKKRQAQKYDRATRRKGDPLSRERVASEVQIVTEIVLAVIDPNRTRLPAPRFYANVKERLGLVMRRPRMTD